MKHWIAAGAAALLVACGGESGAPGEERVAPTEESAMTRIEGNVVYRERIALPPGVEVAVQLEDISRADALATVLVEVSMSPRGGPPYPFVIDYPSAQIDERMRYALRATIRMGDELLFTNTDYIDPFTGNPVEVLVRKVPRSPAPSGPGLEDTRWGLATLGAAEVGPGAGGNPVDLTLSAEEQRAAGFSGCNRYSGAYSREGDSQHGTPLKIGPTAGTMMACPEGMELEQTYLQMLGKVDAFRLVDGTLVLLAGGEELATFTPLQD